MKVSEFEAVAIGCRTLVGIDKTQRPDEHGNCFSVFTKPITREQLLSVEVKEVEYRIVNFNVENLEALIELGLTWPIQCKALEHYIAIIHDARIGERWYQKKYCEVCCPEELLPINQKQVHEREIMRGHRKEYDGFVQLHLGAQALFP